MLAGRTCRRHGACDGMAAELGGGGLTDELAGPAHMDLACLHGGRWRGRWCCSACGWLWRWFWREPTGYAWARRIRAMPVVEGKWPVALTAAAFGGLAQAQVSGVTVMPLAQLLLALTLGLLLAAVADEAPERSFPRASRLVGGLLPVGLVMATLASAWLSPCGPFANSQAVCTETASFWSSNPITRSRE